MNKPTQSAARFVALLAALLAGFAVAVPLALAGSPGGAGVTIPGVPPPTGTTPSTAPGGGSTTPAPRRTGPFDGRGMWIWQMWKTEGGNVAKIIARARANGIRTLYIKSSDGSYMWHQFTPELIAELKRAGLRVCGWQYVYGTYPTTEAQLGAQAVQDGAQCLIIDAESEYEGRYAAAQQYMTTLRKLVGPNFPVSLAGFPYVHYHPAFPYSVFLGPGGAQFNQPQMYWKAIGTTVDRVFATTLTYNVPYGRPILPIGQTYDNPRAGAIARFRRLALAFHTRSVSWWDWQESGTQEWRAVSGPMGSAAASSAPPVWGVAVLALKSKGDLVVWAQEHLAGAGLKVSVDGDFGPATQRAVKAFQESRGIETTGQIGPYTWRALLRVKPVMVKWTKSGAKARAAVASVAGGTPPPKSAALPARRREIPPKSHAGR